MEEGKRSRSSGLLPFICKSRASWEHVLPAIVSDNIARQYLWVIERN